MKFLKYFCAASLLAASAGTLWSCDDDDDKRLSDAVLASVSSLTFEAQDTSEKIITVYADADWVTEIPDWVTVTPTEGTGVMDVTVSVSENMRDGAMDNPRKAKLVFKGRTLASRAEVLVSQVGNKFRDIPEYQKIGDVIALDDEAAVKIPSALVMAVTNKGFIISDDQQSGAIFVEDTEKVAVGDKVCVWGTKSSDGAKLPIISCAEKSDDPNREGDKLAVLSSGATDLPHPDGPHRTDRHLHFGRTQLRHRDRLLQRQHRLRRRRRQVFGECPGYSRRDGSGQTERPQYHRIGLLRRSGRARTPDHSDYDRGQGRSRNRLLDRRFRMARTLGYRRRQ